MGEFVLNFNGARFRVNAPPEETLLSVLRNWLKLTGTKYGCGEGQCGACTLAEERSGTLLPVRPAVLVRNRIELHRRRGGECNDTATIAGMVYHRLLDRLWQGTCKTCAGARW
jgi:hypothetical protein